MPERARAVVLASTGTGDIIPNATVTVRNPGTTVNISETIYVNDDPDTSQYTNGAFFTNATGLVTFYLTNPKRVDVLFTKTGYTSVTIPVDVQNSATGYGLVQEEGSNLTARAKLNFIGSTVTAADDAANGRTNVTITAGGHVIKDAGVTETTRANLDFQDGFIVTDNAGADSTDVDLDYGTTTELADVDTAAELAGTSALVARADHKHKVAPKITRAYLSAAQSLTSGADSLVGFPNESRDDLGMHDNVTNNDRFTVPAGKAGWYRLTAQARFAANATGRREIYFSKNGSTLAADIIVAGKRTSVASIDAEVFTITGDVNLAVGDYVVLYAVQTSGGALNIEAFGVEGGAGTWASVEHLGA